MLEKTQLILRAASEGCFKIQMVLLWFYLSVVGLHKGRLENDFSKRDRSDGGGSCQTRGFSDLHSLRVFASSLEAESIFC